MRRITKKQKQAWVKWLTTYTPEQFLESFLENVEGAVSTCQYCERQISVNVTIGGGVVDWGIDGDFGCNASPDTDDEGTGGHMPVKVS